MDKLAFPALIALCSVALGKLYKSQFVQKRKYFEKIIEEGKGSRYGLGFFYKQLEAGHNIDEREI